MRHYLDYYFDIYWDLHLGVKGDAIPAEVRQIGESFNTVLAFRNPMQPIVYENYMKVRALLDFLKSWIDEQAQGRRQRAHCQSGEDHRLVLAEECRQRRAFQQEGHGLRVLPQFRGAQPMGQHDLRHHVAAEQGRRRRRRARVVREDDGRRLRQRERRAVHAARAVRDGAVPHDIAERRQHLRDRGCQREAGDNYGESPHV